MFVPWLPVSANKLRYAHWTKASKSGRRAREAWQSSLASSPAAAANLMTMAMSLPSSHSETPLPKAWDSTTQTNESGLNTANSKQEPNKV